MAETKKKYLFNRGVESDHKAEMSFIDHLEALRWHIVRSGLVWLAAAIVLFINVDWIFDHIFCITKLNDLAIF